MLVLAMGDRFVRIFILPGEKLLRRPLMHVLVLLNILDLFREEDDALVKLFRDNFGERNDDGLLKELMILLATNHFYI